MSKKLKILIPVIAVAVAAVIAVVLILVLNRKDAYRTIQVYELTGSASVERENIGTLAVYNNMMLSSGDVLTVDADSYLLLKLDGDKYVLVEPDSVLEMIAEGTQKNSQTVINLKQGAIVNRIDTELNAKSSYEVNTSSSTMAIRGTVFRVAIAVDENGEESVTLAVFDGSVESAILDASGEAAPDTVLLVKEGNQVSLNLGGETVSYGDMEDVDYEDLSVNVLEFLDEVWKDKRELVITEEEIESLIENALKPQTYTVTFYVDGTVFATQLVTEGETAVCPRLQPEETGMWDYDFDTPVTADTDILWISENVS